MRLLCGNRQTTPIVLNVTEAYVMPSCLLLFCRPDSCRTGYISYQHVIYRKIDR